MSLHGGSPVVSVVLPTRDRATTVLASVRSVLEGTFDSLELIVVDDASTDATADVLDSVGDPRLKVQVLDRAGGAARARNIGIESAVGEFVAFQDSDDEWTPEHLEVLIAALRSHSPTTAVAYGVAVTDRGERIPPSGHPVRDGDLRRTLAMYNVVPLPASVVRRNALDEVGGFDPVLPRLQDWDLFLGLSQQYRFAFVDRVVLRVGTGPGRITTNHAAYHVAVERILARHTAVFELVPRAAASHRMRMAKHHLSDRAVVSALREFGAALRHPVGLFSWAYERLLRGRSPVARV